MSARLYYSMGHYNAALLYFNNTIDLYEGTIASAKSHYFKGRILEKRKKTRKAIYEYEKVISFEGDIEEKDDAKRYLDALLKKERDEG